MNIELAPQFVQDINWTMLKEQKLDLLQTLNDLEKEAKEANSAGEPELAQRYLKQTESLEGILNLIDGIQDYAVDICGIPEEKVFNIDND